MDLTRQVFAALGVLGLLLLLVLILRRANRGIRPWFALAPKEDRVVQVLERVPLTAQHSLHVIRIAGSVLLIATGPSGASVLRECGPAGTEVQRSDQLP